MNLAKLLAVRKGVLGVAVAATKWLFAIGFSLLALVAKAGVLPEERFDTLYHSYDGGGVTIDGPSVLLRKNVNDRFSFSGNYYVDMVTSASIDVITTASEYTEERTEYTLGVDYLNDRTIMGATFTNSTENDYIADTFSLNVSQEFFGDLSTITMGYAQGDDTVKRTGDPSFEEAAERRRYNLGFSQILTPSLLVSIGYEAVIDEGFLRNPYRQYRYFDGTATNNFSNAPEQYPNTRNSDAYSIRGIYYIKPLGSSIRLEYRDYSDSWDVEAQNYELRYSHPVGDRLIIEARYRTYSQSQAFFYTDLAPSENFQTFIARDKELSQYSANQFGLGITYTFKSRYSFFNNSTLNIYWDRMTFDYDNFRDASQTENFSVGAEPLYSLEADIIRIYYSAFF